MALIPMTGRRTAKVRVLYTFIIAVLVLGILIHLFPIFWMLGSSLKSSREVIDNPTGLWPKEPSGNSYKLLFTSLLRTGGAKEFSVFRYPLFRYIKNSLIIVLSTMALQIPITMMLAYCVSKVHSRRTAKVLFYISIGTLMVPSEVSIIPRFLLLSHFPWPTMDVPNIPFTSRQFPSISFIGSYLGIILPSAFNAFNFLLFKGYFDTLPQELYESARVDGCSEMGMLWRITLPLSLPIVVVTSYFSFVASWNKFFGPWIILMGRPEKWPISIVLYKLQAALVNWQPAEGAVDPTAMELMSSGVGFNALMALALIETIPLFILFIVFREYVMKGIRLQGFK